MGEIFVVVEHRKGEIREITLEMLNRADQLCRQHGHTLTAVLLAGPGNGFADRIGTSVDRLIAFEAEPLEVFNAQIHKEVLYRLVMEHRPVITLMGHTAWGVELAPALSIKTGYPLVTDCVDVQLDEGRPTAVRQVYSGKLFSKVAFRESDGYLVTVRPGTSPPEPAEGRAGEIVTSELPADLPLQGKQFVEFQDAGAGEVDITQAELLVSIGRGIGDEENIEQIKELADLMGGTLSCSRPVVDKNWLPKYHQVGTSGKSVKPKVYLAFGISGAFQHVAGIAGAGTVIAVNKDKKAPIFRVADFGVADDLFRVAEALKEKLAADKG
jgi:electron transfer flavoprotein alpha subunit